MPWAKLDDRYDDTRKIKRAWKANRALIGLHAMAITYCARHQTDGIVDLEWLEERLPNDKERAKTVAQMVEHDLFEPVDDEHWRLHDYLKHNASKDEREVKRRSDRRRKIGRRLRAEIIARDGLVCGICGLEIESVEDVDIDHVQRVALGGLTIAENLRVTHSRCNRARGNRD
jgi:hypothetical protein